MTTDTLYTSTPLGPQDIRVLHLYPSTDFYAPIRCILNVISLELESEPGPADSDVQRPVYQALSYVWGDNSEANRRTILVDGQQVDVTVNLALALRRLRAHHTKNIWQAGHSDDLLENKNEQTKDYPPAQPLIIWVDAICINQADPDERASQVSMMGRIYKSCSEVAIWLGPIGCEDVVHCLDWDDLLSSPTTSSLPSNFDIPLGLEQCARNLATLSSPQAKSSLHFHDLAPKQDSAGAVTSEHEVLSSSMIQAMAQLAQSTYFTRAWVVQEAHLSPKRTIYFGNITMPSEELWTSYANRKYLLGNCTDCMKGETPFSLYNSMIEFLGQLVHLGVIKDPVGLLRTTTVGPDGKEESYYNHEVHTNPEMGLLEYTIRRRVQNCTDPRDKIYAYLGIVEDWLEIILNKLERRGLEVKVDYTIDDSQGETVYTKARDLYLQMCCDAVNKGRSLAFLGWDTGKSTALEQHNGRPLPSWALDWMYHGGSGESMHMFDCFSWNANKGMKFDAGVLDAQGSKVLVSKATWRVDKVVKVGCPYAATKEACDNWHNITGLRDPEVQDKMYANGKETWSEAWWKALCFVSDNAQKKWTDKDIAAFELVNAIVDNAHWNFRPPMKISKTCSDTLPVGEIVQSKEMMAELFKSSINPIMGTMALRLDDKVLFVTERGYIGFGRAGIKEGDAMFLLGGCKTPLVIRETSEAVKDGVVFEGEELKGKRLYELVSGAFVYGIMDGELLGGQERDLPSLETICIA
ncbi:Heterokaryon incompatibility protein (HET) domain containing protein [Naviculisporaceae sp. PSN 640]